MARPFLSALTAFASIGFFVASIAPEPTTSLSGLSIAFGLAYLAGRLSVGRA